MQSALHCITVGVELCIVTFTLQQKVFVGLLQNDWNASVFMPLLFR